MSAIAGAERQQAPTGSTFAVEVVDLVKRFHARRGGTVTAVDGVSFTVRPGEVFGFLGPNGAGKTTTLEIIEGLRSPTSGHTAVLGLDSVRDRARMKERIGVQLQQGAYFEYLTLEEILRLFGSFYPRRNAPETLLERVGLLDKRRALVKELSGGQAHRFAVVAALVPEPEVIFLDEPTTGLDPQARRNLWEFISTINREDGKTVVLTTHYMEEAEALCDRVAIIDHGKIQALDAPLGLIDELPAAYRIVFSTPSGVEEEELRRFPGVVEVRSERNAAGASYELRVARGEVTLPAFLEWARLYDVEVRDVRVFPATLEDVFLSLTGRALRE